MAASRRGLLGRLRLRALFFLTLTSVDAIPGRPWRLQCPNRTSHGPGVPTLELVLPSRVAQTLAAAHANRATAVPVWRCTRYLWVTTVQLVRRPVFSERAGQRWKGRGASLREAVARVASNLFLRDINDINVGAPLADGRCGYWRMGCPCGRAPGRPSTQPWSAGGRHANTCRSCPLHCA